MSWSLSFRHGIILTASGSTKCGHRMYCCRAVSLCSVFGLCELDALWTDRVREGVGLGTYGTVVKAEDMVTGTFIAVKFLHQIANLHPDIHAEEDMYRRLVEGCSPSIRLVHPILAQARGSKTSLEDSSPSSYSQAIISVTTSSPSSCARCRCTTLSMGELSFHCPRGTWWRSRIRF